MLGSADVHFTALPAIGLPSPSYSAACRRIVSPAAASRTWPGVITSDSDRLPPLPGATAPSLQAVALESRTIEQRRSAERTGSRGLGIGLSPPRSPCRRSGG